MSSPADPDNPVLATPDDVADALRRRFLANADAGNNAANDDLVAQLAAWKRRKRQGDRA